MYQKSYVNMEQEDCNKITHQEEILKEAKKLYKHLRNDTLEDIDLKEYMKENEVVKLINCKADNINGVLTNKETAIHYII